MIKTYQPIKFNRSMTIQLILSPSEALHIAAALDFVRGQMTLDEKSAAWRFRDGGRFDCQTKDLLSLGYVSARIAEACENESNRVHYAGCCNFN